MNQNIKTRIEQIGRGEVPEGYKKVKTGVIPEKWSFEKLGKYLVQYHEVTTQNNQYPVLTSSRRGIFLQSEYYNSEVASDDNTGYNIVPRGYFTYRHMSDDEIFHFNINTLVDNGIVSTLYPVFTTTDKINDYFLQTILNEGRDFHRYAVLQKQGGSRTYMYFEKLKALSLPIPPIEEQERIAGILGTQDKLIALKEKRIVEKKQQKKYLMQQLLTGKKRLPGVIGEWKKTKAGNFISFISGYAFSSKFFNEEGMGKRLIRNRDLKTDEQRIYTTEDCIKDYCVKQGDILVGMDGEFCLCRWSSEDALLNQRVGKIIVKDNISSGFIFYSLSYPLLKAEEKTGATTVKHLSNKVVLGIEIDYPTDIEEQQAIADILSQADKEIELLQKDLEEEKVKKKALMQLLLTGIVRTEKLKGEII